MRSQLLGLGFSRKGIECRLAAGRLHVAWPGVYAVGRPALSQHGRWMAAVLACGPHAVLSHESAAALWGVRRAMGGPVYVSVPVTVSRRARGIVVHRRTNLAPNEATSFRGIPVTNPVCTLIDLAAGLRPSQLERAINQADQLELVDPERLRQEIARLNRRPGLPALRRVLDARTFTLTDSELERLFLPQVRSVGLPTPLTRESVEGFDVDFFWPDLGLVVETDGLRYHRTPAEQARDRLRDQVHTAAGLTPLRFTHWQVKYDGAHVCTTLAAVARRLRQRS